MNYPYEIHITVEQCEINHFKRYCHDAGLKPLLIDLQKSGQSIGTQLMASQRWMSTEYRHVVANTLAAVKFLVEKNLNVQRIKIETSLDNTLLLLHGAAYFECHVPVEIKSPADLENIQSFLFSNWHVSQNAFKKLDNCEVYFLTYRDSIQSSLETAVSELTRHLANLQVCVHNAKIERECVLLDTNESLDLDWIKNHD